MKFHSVLTFAVVVYTFLPASVLRAAVVIPTSFGLGADAYTQGSNPTTNYGASGVITSRNNAGNAPNNYKDYFRFDLSGIERGSVLSAAFEFVTLTAATTSRTFQLYGLVDALPGDAAPTSTGWVESTINYNNAPGNVSSTTDLGLITTSPGDENGDRLTLLGSVTLNTAAANSTISMSFPALATFLNADTNNLVTLVLRRTDSNGVLQLASKENTSSQPAPSLLVSAALSSPIPEPSPTLLLPAGSGWLILWRKRRES